MSAAPAAGGIFPYTTHTFTLGNGLKVIMIPMSSGGLMSYYSIVRTGSRDEFEAGKTGFAHFVEHMMFRGTKNFPAKIYDRMVTEMGADANAYTTDDYTAYHLTFAAEDLETVIKLESDRFQFLDYEEEAFQTEAGAVYGEYRKNRSNPWEVLFESLQQTAFTTHTYGHTTMGYEADIKAMPTLFEYSKEFFSRYYRPENVVLLLTGDFDVDDARELIERYYGSWEKGYVAPQIPSEPRQQQEKRVNVVYDGETLPLLVVGYKGAAFKPKDRRTVAGYLLEDLLFGETSALYKDLVLKRQLVQYISAGFDRNRDPGLWNVYAMVKKQGDVPLVLREIDKTVEHWQKTLVGKDELAKLKKRLRYQFLMNLDTPDKVAGRLARYVALTGGITAIDALYATIDAITPEDVRDAAQYWLVKNQRTVATLKGRK
ncbi:MAG TPA: pitrilysin family protein [Bacteroidota bacterium]|nr:pitrilysin family protein [Bacteroidota bacterium]